MARSLSFRLSSFLRRFARQEQGVAFIVFALCLSLFVVALLAVEQSLSASEASQEEKNTKTKEIVGFLAKEYSSNLSERVACANTGSCEKSGNATARVLKKNYSEYGPVGDGNGGDPVAMAEMAEYVQRSFNSDKGNNVAGFRFQDIISQEVTRTCHAGRIMLTLTVKAKQYTWFLQTDRKITVTADQLTDAPCSSDKLKPQGSEPYYYKPTPDKSACQHLGPDVEHYFMQQPFPIDLTKVRSVTNFVLSLDADSAKLMEELNGNNYTKRFGAALTGFYKGFAITDGSMSAAMVRGNFPNGSGGPPICKDSGSGLAGTSGCYDSETKMDFSGGLSEDSGIENNSRKPDENGNVLTGEMRAQYTRHCPSSEAVWTYKTKWAGQCYDKALGIRTEERNQLYGHADIVGSGGFANDYATKNNLIQYCQDHYGAESDALTPPVTIDADADESKCPADGGTGACKQYHVTVWCIGKNNDAKNVYRGEWTPACKSVELGGNPDKIYTSPAQLVKFRGRLVADLYNKPVSAGMPKLEVVGTPVVSSKPQEMRAVDSDILNQVKELKNLHIKNTERSLIWACDSGPIADDGSMANNGGNLTSPYGVRVSDAAALLDVSGTVPTPLAKNANNKKGCTLPVLANTLGSMTDTTASYDINFKRDNCSGPLCDIPEGLYAMSMEPGARNLEPSQQPLASAPTTPDGGLKTRWKAPDGGDDGQNWAWGAIGNVEPSGLGQECPKTPTSNCTNVQGLSGRTFCVGADYMTVKKKYAGDCGGDGSNCPHISDYIVHEDDAPNKKPWGSFAYERLNVGAVAMERRLIELKNEMVPYTCMLDKAETTGGTRSSIVYVADQGNLKCDWKNGDPFYCQKNSGTGADSVTPDQVEEKFVDDSQGGIFSLTPSTFTGPIAVGDDKEEFIGGVKNGRNNFHTQPKYVTQDSVKSLIDNSLSIMPVQVQAAETTHLHNSDYPATNFGSATYLTQDAQNMQFRFGWVAEGYKGYDIFPMHRNNQCGLVKQGMRLLQATNQGTLEGSKFLVYIGALPTEEAYKTLIPMNVSNHTNATNKPGDYDGTGLHMRSVATNPTTTNLSVAFIHDCIGSISSLKVSGTTTPFIVTTLPPGATNGPAVLQALIDATADTTNETCKRPFCILSNKDKDGSAFGLGPDADNVMQPETCAAKLWKCISTPVTK